MEKIRLLELFGGIGACTKAFKRTGIPFEVVDYVEIDQSAVNSYNAMNGTNFEPQDIMTWDKDIKVDMIMHGSPCQDISLAGKQLGADEDSGTRSSLMYETIRIVEKLKPKYVIWENVKNIISKKHRHNFDNYLERMEELGYVNHYQVLNAKDYGIPQNRERVFTISIKKELNQEFTFPEKQELKIKLKDMLEENVDEKYFLSTERVNKIQHSNFAQEKSRIQEKEICDTLLARDYKDPKCIEIKNGTKKGYLEAYDGDGVYIETSKNKRGTVQPQSIQTLTTRQDVGVVVEEKLPGAYGRNYGSKGKIQSDECCNTLTASMGEGGGNVPLTKSELRIRKLTPKECWRLMGFDDEDYEKASEKNSATQLYKQAGNSIVVNVLEGILNNLFKE